MGSVIMHAIPTIGIGPAFAAVGGVVPATFQDGITNNLVGDDGLAGRLGDPGNPGVSAWNHFYLLTPTLPATAYPVQLQSVWFLGNAQDATVAPLGDVYIRAEPQPYYAGDVHLYVAPGTQPTGFASNWAGWNPAWPLDKVLISILAPANVFCTEVIFQLYYADPPTAHFTVPTTNGAVIADTVRPFLQWTYAQGDNGGPQTAYQVWVYTQAQTQAAGFVPGTSTAVWNSQVVHSSVSSVAVPINLANNTQYVAYLRVAQTVNGFEQWAVGYATRTFSISIPAASVPAQPTVTATADSANARIAVTVSQSSTPAWDHVIVERSVDDGATWTVVRSGDVDIAPGATLSIWDYETGNGEVTVYRAQAQRTATTGGITQVTVSQYSLSSAEVAWTSDSVWLKSPLFPGFNTTVRLGEFGTFTRRMARGVFDVVGRSTPLVVSDVRHGLEGQMTISVRSLDELHAIRFMSDLSSTVLLQAPPSFNFGSHYLALGDEHEDRVNIVASNPYRWFQFDFVEVDAPVGDLIDTALPPVVVEPPPTSGYLLDEAGNYLTDEAGNRLTGF